MHIGLLPLNPRLLPLNLRLLPLNLRLLPLNLRLPPLNLRLLPLNLRLLHCRRHCFIYRFSGRHSQILIPIAENKERLCHREENAEYQEQHCILRI